MWTLDTILLVAGAFLAGGLVKGTIGLGFVVVVLAFLATTIGLKEAIALLIVPGIVANLWQAFVGGAFTHIVRRLWTLLLASLFGIWLGVGILARVDTNLLVMVLGAVLICYAAFSLRRPQIPAPGGAEAWLSPIVGISSGLLCGMTGSFIVPGILYVQALGLNRDTLVQAMGIIFLVTGIFLGLVLWRYGIMNAEIALVSTATLIPMAIGMFAGQKIRHRLPEARFRQLFFSGLLLVGGYMVAKVL